MAERRLARCGGNAALPVREYSPERLGDREEVFTCLSSGAGLIRLSRS